MLNSNNGDWLKKKTNEILSRKIWPLPSVQDQEESTRDTCFQRIINRPDQPRSRNLLRADRSVVFAGTVDDNDCESFHCAISSILGAAQCFGILPVCGVRSESPRKLEFKIFSPLTAYAVTITIMLFMMASTSICHMLHTLKTDNFGSISFATSGAIIYINNFVSTVFFIWLAPHWISLQRDWRAMERFLDRMSFMCLYHVINFLQGCTGDIFPTKNESRDNPQSPRLRWKFSMMTAAIMLVALLEHVLFIMSLIPLEFWSTASNLTIQDLIQSVCEMACPSIFTICNYNLGIGIFILYINTVGSFMWNFTDVFIMLVSTGLAERYNTLNRKLKGTTSLYGRKVDWRHLRESYATLSTLVKRVDNNISPIILLSFITNLYFICLQLFYGLSPKSDHVLATIYSWVSFVLLVGRTVSVTLLAARINDQSTVALPEIYNCPAPAYNIESQRLQQQLSTDKVCLTGMGFFSITRNFMVAVAGTIVTYEVLLLNSVSQ